jgi:hypothetical protein
VLSIMQGLEMNLLPKWLRPKEKKEPTRLSEVTPEDVREEALRNDWYTAIEEVHETIAKLKAQRETDPLEALIIDINSGKKK